MEFKKFSTLTQSFSVDDFSSVPIQSNQVTIAGAQSNVANVNPSRNRLAADFAANIPKKESKFTNESESTFCPSYDLLLKLSREILFKSKIANLLA